MKLRALATNVEMKCVMIIFSSLTLLLAVQITRHGQLTLHLTDLRWIHHPLLKLLHLLPSALIVVSCLQTETMVPISS